MIKTPQMLTIILGGRGNAKSDRFTLTTNKIVISHIGITVHAYKPMSMDQERVFVISKSDIENFQYKSSQKWVDDGGWMMEVEESVYSRLLEHFEGLF